MHVCQSWASDYKRCLLSCKLYFPAQGGHLTCAACSSDPALTTWRAMSQWNATAAWLGTGRETHLGQEGLGRRRGMFRHVGPQLRRHPPEAHIEGRPALHQLQSAPALLNPLLACLRQLICPVHPPRKSCIAVGLHTSASKILLPANTVHTTSASIVKGCSRQRASLIALSWPSCLMMTMSHQWACLMMTSKAGPQPEQPSDSCIPSRQATA